ncbi:MAG: DUF350 domain-containing protein [Pseudopedobacter saltans]|uniref:DUF350 domain-containing protein n=1 Tax=Pseudopedobacter saltans TaxID=151895 RepID=A0A2W5FAM3_9SPHI|nr:MAG: DUF350 domain-containing protein [Pseudopedobacter saltans]
MPNLINLVIGTLVFSFLGLGILLLAYYVVERITPEKTWKEIVENKNIALAIVIASLIIGISMIISAAIHG